MSSCDPHSFKPLRHISAAAAELLTSNPGDPLKAFGAALHRYPQHPTVAMEIVTDPGCGVNGEHCDSLALRAYPSGDAPIIMAACAKRADVVRALITAGADVSLKSTKLHSMALHIAAYNDDVETIDALLNARASPFDFNDEPKNPLHKAAQAGAIKAIALFSSHPTLSKDTVKELLLEEDGDGLTPLHISLMEDQAAAVHALLALGSDTRGTLQVVAVLAGLAKYIPSLQEHGADVDECNIGSFGWTPLHQAAREENSSCVQMLLDHGASVSIIDIDGATALHRAAGSDAVGAIALLLDHGADLDAFALDIGGLTPLHFAADKLLVKAAAILVADGANIRLTDMDGRTALTRMEWACGDTTVNPPYVQRLRAILTFL